MDKNELRVYYHDPSSVLVVNPKGQMRKLYTPFRVLCVKTVNHFLATGTWAYVDEVKTNRKDELIFVVGGRPYPHQHFHIRINF